MTRETVSAYRTSAGELRATLKDAVASDLVQVFRGVSSADNAASCAVNQRSAVMRLLAELDPPAQPAPDVTGTTDTKKLQAIRALIEFWLYGGADWCRDHHWLNAWWGGYAEAMQEAEAVFKGAGNAATP